MNLGCWAVRRLALEAMPRHVLANGPLRVVPKRSVLVSPVRLGLAGAVTTARQHRPGFDPLDAAGQTVGAPAGAMMMEGIAFPGWLGAGRLPVQRAASVPVWVGSPASTQSWMPSAYLRTLV